MSDTFDTSSFRKLGSEATVKMLTQLQDSLVCSICQGIMFCPCVTSCGHTYCYNCLYEWFKGRIDNKTCPNCRHKLSTKPALSVQLKDIASILVKSLVAVNPEKKEEFEHAQQKAMAEYEEDMQLLNETFPHQFDIDERPMIDDREDGVRRCPHCNWEMHGSYCERCDRYVAGMGGRGESESEDDEALGHEYGSDYEVAGGDDTYEHDGFVVSDEEADETRFDSSVIGHLSDSIVDEDDYEIEDEDNESNSVHTTRRRRIVDDTDSEVEEVDDDDIVIQHSDSDDNVAPTRLLPPPRRAQHVVFDSELESIGGDDDHPDISMQEHSVYQPSGDEEDGGDNHVWMGFDDSPSQPHGSGSETASSVDGNVRELHIAGGDVLDISDDEPLYHGSAEEEDEEEEEYDDDEYEDR